jgi:hypothetical protein
MLMLVPTKAAKAAVEASPWVKFIEDQNKEKENPQQKTQSANERAAPVQSAPPPPPVPLFPQLSSNCIEGLTAIHHQMRTSACAGCYKKSMGEVMSSSTVAALVAGKEERRVRNLPHVTHAAHDHIFDLRSARYKILMHECHGDRPSTPPTPQKSSRAPCAQPR